MALSLKYTSESAFEAVRLYYPNEWETIIEEGKRYLKSLAKSFNCDEQKAYKKVISGGGSVEGHVKLFAALHIILEENGSVKSLVAKIEELEIQAKNISEQSLALESQNTFNIEDKKILRSYYSKIGISVSNQILEIQQRLDKLINSSTVVEPVLIIHQLDIFQQKNN